jgi:putative CocE/NonD family hydrolase
MTTIEVSDVGVPMRDGVRLYTRLYVPPGGPHPALLRRTPYPWEWRGADAFNLPNEEVAARGYAHAVQYVRGRFASEGTFEPFRDDVADGYDAIQWLTEQPWCNGRVGMYGQSYEATAQTAAVVSGHPALACIVPQAFGLSFTAGFPYHSPGVFALGAALGWAAQVVAEAESVAAEPHAGATVEQTGNEIYEMYAAAAKTGWHEGLLDMTTAFRHHLDPVLAKRPGRDLELMRVYAPWWRSWVDARSAADPYWADISVADRPDLAIPALHISGWLDQFVAGTIERFVRWRNRAATPELRTAQRLIVGPWAHGLSSEQWHGHVAAVPEADLFAHDDISAFLRHWLLNDHDALADDAPIRIYVMGTNVWRDEWEWPLARTVWTPLYLRAGGSLSLYRPGNEDPDRFDHDPRNPVPAIGGAVVPGLVLPGPGQYDQRSVEERPDVLVYTAAALEADLEATGPVSADLWVRSSAVDTDFTAKLVDVFPDGRAVFVSQGIVRPTIATLGTRMDPDCVYRVNVHLDPTSYVFRRGHSVRLEVASSCFPIWDVNPNTGRHYFNDETGKATIAHQQVFHDRERPSHLTLPVVPG